MKKILIVDDDDDIREIISLVLKEEGFKVRELNNGSQVLETVNIFKPDIILLDVMLGDADGRDICKKLKNQSSISKIPIIIISATHGIHTKHEKNCGADSYISKLFDISYLSRHVNQYMIRL